MITNPNGVYPVLDFDSQDNWKSLLRLVQPDLDQKGLQRLEKVLSGKCQCVVVERHYIDKDYRDTFYHFHSKRFSTPSSRCTRLHFFKEKVTENSIIDDVSATISAYLGYSIIRPTKPNCIGRTMLSHTLRLRNEAHVSLCEETVDLLGSRLGVKGFPFISQDTDATVCAESSLWMLLRYYSNRYPWYSEILPFQITSLTANHSVGSRVYPSSGLYSWQLAESLRLRSFSPVVYNRKEIEKEFPGQFDHLLYTYIESGLPLLIMVPRHTMVAFGHMSDYTVSIDTQRETPFIYSSHFNKAYVVHDDNFFPYQMLHREGQGLTNDSTFKWQDIEEFIVPLPEKVFLTAEHVRKAIETLLTSSNPKVNIESNSPSLKGARILLRLFLTTARSFKRKLRTRKMGHQIVESVYRKLPLPHFVWVCEIAHYEDYAQKKEVVGEVVWDATRNAHDTDGWLAVHYPEKLIWDAGSPLNKPKEMRFIPLPGNNSYCLFQSNLHSL